MEALAGRLLASRGISGAGARLDAADLRGVADEEVVDALLRSEYGADFRARLARLRKAFRAGRPTGRSLRGSASTGRAAVPGSPAVLPGALPTPPPRRPGHGEPAPGPNMP